MTWTPPAVSVYTIENAPSTNTPLDKTHIEAAHTVDQNFTISAIQSAIPFLQTLESNSQGGASYTFALTDAGLCVVGTRATAQAFTVPPHSSIAFPVNTVLTIMQYGTGQITWTAGAGVTLSPAAVGEVKTAAKNAISSAWQYIEDEWILMGNLAS